MYQQACDIILNALQESGRDIKYVDFEINRSHCTVLFYGQYAAFLKIGKRAQYLTVHDRHMPIIEHNQYRVYTVKGERLSSDAKLKRTSLAFDTMLEFSLFTPLFLHMYDNIVKDETFDCCSAFMECSEKLSCVRDNPDIYLNCNYRLKLNDGIVFFGKNRNI